MKNKWYLTAVCLLMVFTHNAAASESKQITSEADINLELGAILTPWYDKLFIQRLFNYGQYKVLKHVTDDGQDTVISHALDWSCYEPCDIYYIYPTVIQKNGILEEHSPDDAFTINMESGNYISIDNMEDAQFVMDNYRQYIAQYWERNDWDNRHELIQGM